MVDEIDFNKRIISSIFLRRLIDLDYEFIADDFNDFVSKNLKPSSHFKSIEDEVKERSNQMHNSSDLKNIVQDASDDLRINMVSINKDIRTTFAKSFLDDYQGNFIDSQNPTLRDYGHPDGIENHGGASYIRIWNNYIANFANDLLFFEGRGAKYQYIKIYNNIWDLSSFFFNSTF